MHSAKVSPAELDYSAEDGLYYLGTEPFTGTVEYRVPPGGWLEAEIEYREGQQWGRKRTWFAPGQPNEEADFAWGRHHGVVREWDETGRLIREGEYQYGVKISETRWGPQGGVTAVFRPTAETWERVRIYREALGADAEPHGERID